ncbi:MAG: hypothetical protein ABIG90_01725 [bacterium]
MRTPLGPKEQISRCFVSQPFLVTQNRRHGKPISYVVAQIERRVLSHEEWAYKSRKQRENHPAT